MIREPCAVTQQEAAQSPCKQRKPDKASFLFLHGRVIKMYKTNLKEETIQIISKYPSLLPPIRILVIDKCQN